MESTNLAEVATANFELNRLLLEIQGAQATLALAEMEYRIAVLSTDLAFTRYQKSLISLRIALSTTQL